MGGGGTPEPLSGSATVQLSQHFEILVLTQCPATKAHVRICRDAPSLLDTQNKGSRWSSLIGRSFALNFKCSHSVYTFIKTSPSVENRDRR